MRTMHPRDALNHNSSDAYGSIVLYYRYTGQNARQNDEVSKELSLEESIEKGLSVMDTEVFDFEESTIHTRLYQNSSSSLKDNFEKYYDSWIKSYNPENIKYSSPRMIFVNKSYEELLTWSKKQGKKIYPLIIERYLNDNFQNLLLVEDLILPSYSEQLSLVKKENDSKTHDSKGAYFVRTSEVNCLRFIKKVLKTLEEEINKEDLQFVLNQNVPNSVEMETEISFYLPEKSSVSLFITDTQGRKVKTILGNTSFESGTHKVSWDGHDETNRKVSEGIYLYRVITKDNNKTKKLIIK